MAPLTVREVAALLGYSRAWVYRLVHNGVLVPLPRHLPLAFDRDHVERMGGAYRETASRKRYRPRTTCRKGHRLTSGNVYLRTGPDGTDRRICRACRLASNKAWRDREWRRNFVAALTEDLDREEETRAARTGEGVAPDGP